MSSSGGQGPRTWRCLRTKKWKSRVARSRWVLGIDKPSRLRPRQVVPKPAQAYEPEVHCHCPSEFDTSSWQIRAMGMWSLALSQTPAPSDPPMGLVGWEAAELRPA
jgi:hypothetical protein